MKNTIRKNSPLRTVLLASLLLLATALTGFIGTTPQASAAGPNGTGWYWNRYGNYITWVYDDANVHASGMTNLASRPVTNLIGYYKRVRKSLLLSPTYWHPPTRPY
jgi:hypothetical protein